MIRVSDGKIGAREFFAILYAMMAIRITNSTPNLLLDAGLTAAWAMPLLSAAFLFGPLLLLLPLLKKYNAGLLGLLDTLTGNTVGRLITFAMFVAIFSSTSLNSRNYADIVTTMYYSETSVLLILVVLILGASFYIAHRGLEAIGRTALLVVPVFLLTSVLLVIGVAEQLNILYVFPIAGSGPVELVKNSAAYSAFYGDIILVAILYAHVRTHNAFRKAAIWGLWVPAVKMAVFLAVYVMMFDYPAVMNIAFPYHHLTRMAMLGSLANHVEALFLALWFVGAALHFGIYLYLSAYLLGKVVNYKQFEHLILPLAGTAVVLGMIPDNHLQGELWRMLLLEVSSGMFLLLPVLLWTLDRFRKKAKQ
ncbi:spore germination protein (amino acid permease) [Bhargavaea cecembensis DSE10]|uniref:Spore germination protein (Amino acid permease) n=1 Tax=Bhargavaea cecembensis DSE10 TaxID=1235279 RepID=M7P9N2_9BACL|nr:GerAB/ArcD/ProY family transporter [Bhargavaea cecembensis]EMR07199.1 spore germination protein (amino acid permease) [Bhargavaea cecembensis DSE10]